MLRLLGLCLQSLQEGRFCIGRRIILRLGGFEFSLLGLFNNVEGAAFRDVGGAFHSLDLAQVHCQIAASRAIHYPIRLALVEDAPFPILVFTQDQFVFGLSVIGNGQIIESPDSATYTYSDTVIVTALPDTNWAFAGWSGGLSGLENPDTIIVLSDTSVTATFEQFAFVIARDVVGSGALQVDPDSATYALGDTVVVTALPDLGWSFSGWSGGRFGIRPLSFARN